MKKKIISLALIAVLVFAMTIPVSAYTIPSTTKIVIDGTQQNPSVKPVNEDGNNLVHLRMLETIGAEVTWDAAKKAATVKTAAYTAVFTIDSKTYTVNGASKTLSGAPARLVNGSTMIPLRACFECIGATVDFNSSTNTATVNYFTKMTGTLKISGSTTLQPIAQAAADKLNAMNSGLSISVAGGGSGAGIKDAQGGTVNIGMSSRDLTADELKELSAYAVANDGIAIIVHPDNPVKNLTNDQAAKIFLGEIKNWADVGGDNAPIFVMTRETGSGTRATLEEMLLEKKSVVETATPFSSSTLIKQAVAKDKNAIGFDSIGFVDSTVKAVSLGGVDANATTVIGGTYAMGRQLYCATKGQATGVSAMFIDYLRSTDCQNNIVVKEGYVKLG